MTEEMREQNTGQLEGYREGNLRLVKE